MLNQGQSCFPRQKAETPHRLRGASLCHIARAGFRPFGAALLLSVKLATVPKDPQRSRSGRGLWWGDVAKRSASEPRRRPLPERRIDPFI